MWAVLKARVYGESEYHSRDAIIETAQRIWKEMVAEGIHRQLIKSFPDRIAAVIEAQGGRTDY